MEAEFQGIKMELGALMELRRGRNKNRKQRFRRKNTKMNQCFKWVYSWDDNKKYMEEISAELDMHCSLSRVITNNISCIYTLLFPLDRLRKRMKSRN